MTEQYRQTPREILEQKLAQERKNSPVMKALIDKAEFELAHEHPQSSDMDWILERIKRRRRMKRGGEAYSAAAQHDVWIEISKPYLIEGFAEVGRHKGLATVTFDTYYEILFDLRHINERRSRKKRGEHVFPQFSAQEREKTPMARQEMERYLTPARAGSAIIQAFADYAARELWEFVLQEHGPFSSSPNFPLLAVAGEEKAKTEMLITQRRFGSEKEAYNEAFTTAQRFMRRYYQESGVKRVPLDSRPILQFRRDLQQINEGKSRGITHERVAPYH
jgi:hypothetical protein